MDAARRTSLKVFDDHHPPSSDLLSDCVHCGFCLSSCPTYRLWGQEADSPRGRIYLMGLGLEGEVPLDAAYVSHFDRCLGCMACVTSCPSGVQYDRLIEATRFQIERRFTRPAAQKLLRKLIYALFPYPRRLRALALPLWLYQRGGLQALVRRIGLLKLLPPRLRSMEELLPPVNLRGFIRAVPAAPAAAGAPRLRVGLLLGCVQSVFFDHVNRATARALSAEGCEVIVPRGQGCCGALMLHGGEERAAKELARRTIDAFEVAQVDVIAINAAGCGSAMKEYVHLLKDDPAYAKRAERFSARCRDISEILAKLTARAPRQRLVIRVAYHDACHLQHAQRTTMQPRDVLRSIPGLELLEIDDGAICCGSAGIYNLLEPEAAAELGARKAQNILRTGAAAVVSGNPGCTLQIRAALSSLGRPLPILHWIELLDGSITGTMPPALRSAAR
jgi:glycolate oxidase iron-sulfur subunit